MDVAMNDNAASSVEALSVELSASLAAPPAVPSVLDLPHGLHYDIPEESYHKPVFGLVSKHMLDLFEESPLTYRAAVDDRVVDVARQVVSMSEGTTADEADEKEKEHFFIGRAVGCATLEPDRFAKTYICAPDFGYLMKHDASGTTKEQGAENRKRRDAWVSEHKNIICLTNKQWRDVTGMAKSMRSHPRVAALLEAGGRAEVTVRWKDPETSLECKARWDLWTEAFSNILDLKSTRDARQDQFSRDCERYGYHEQAAMYVDGAIVLGIDPSPFLFGVIKKSHPYLRAVYGLDDDAIELGRRRIRRRMQRFADCIDSDVWPGLDEAILAISLPRWARQ